MYFRFGAFFKSLLFSCNVVYLFSIFVMFFWLPYFCPKSFGFLYIRLLVCFRVTPPLLIEFSFVVLESPVLSVFFTLCQYLFNLPSLASTFWFISSSYTVIFSCVACSFFPAYFSASLFFNHSGLFSLFDYLRFQ